MTAVLLAAYNGERYLAAQLDSLLSQSVSDFDIYVHDDGSSDGTADILREYAGRFPRRVHIVEGPPSGGAKMNFWFLLSEVEADFYFFCDQDDVWLPDKVEKERAALRRLGGGEPALVFSDMYVTDSDLNILSDSFWAYIGRDASQLSLGRVLIDNPAAGTSMAINRALRDEALAVDFDLSGVEMHDGFLLSMAILIGKAARLDEPLVYYRQHGGNEMGAAASENRLQRILRNLQDVFSGEFIRKKREFLSLSRAAAAQLARLGGLPKENRKMLETYAHLDSLPKIRRIIFMKKYGFNRAKHTWWMYLWA